MQITTTHNAVEALLAFPFIRSLDRMYPDIAYWYINSVVPNIASGRDILLLAKEGSTIHGVALGKRAADEVKLRCVRVTPAARNTGLGVRLIDRMLALLEVETPSCSVAEELIHQYSRLFINRYGFRLSNVTKGQYRARKLEYHFN